ncbi:SRPBCC domain-containing protein [Brachybacterium sp. 107]|uniref:SRPBCC domain-containing protein n=1 Tax=Brachybacterium sp. 107 TaxID=3457736 RepID=UPI0040337D48
MAITGSLDRDGHDLVLTRSVLAPRARIWDHLTRSDLLATWFGTFAGDPTTGRVQVLMNAEPGEASASEYTIHACDAGELLTVSSSMGEGTWRLSVELDDAVGADEDHVAADAGTEPVTQVRLRHHDVPIDMIQHVGPGWEWYLDRLVGTVTGGDIPGMEVWDTRYMSLSEDYAALAR